MKKIIRLFLVACFSLLVFTACNESTKVEPTQSGHQHTLTSDSWLRDSATHWKECSNCDEYVDMGLHQYADWVQSTIECKKSRECSVCGFKQTQSNSHVYEDGKCTICGKNEPGTVTSTPIKATEPMKIYVKAPADWKDVTCWYWQDDAQGEPGDGSEIEYSEQATMWPGYSMTLVDEENNIWGFKIPKGTNMIIFSNNGTPQSVDLKLVGTNYYVLNDEATSGKYEIWEYSTYEDNSGLTLNQYPSADVKPEYEMTTIYAQFPASWEGQNICFWETALGNWPNFDAMTVVDAEKHIYKFEIPVLVTELEFVEKANGEKTGTVKLVNGANIYVVTSNEGTVSVKAQVYDPTAGTVTDITE